MKMTDDLFTRLKAIDEAILTDVVRQDLRSSSFEITNWSVQRLSDKGIINPNGLWLLSGQGHEGGDIRPWSVVVKIFERPKQEAPPDDMWYWKRELMLAQSGLMDCLPGPLKAPRFYRIDEQPEDVWLWMEHINKRCSETWILKDFAFAAHELGCWNGACITQTKLPTEIWLARRHYISWLSWMNVEKDWQFPLNKVHVSVKLRSQYEQLWAERDMFYRVLEKLPQVFSHFDSQRRNLFICKNSEKQAELIAIDWSYCGIGPLGVEINGLVINNGYMLEWPSTDLTNLEAAVFPSYLQGLHDAGWSGNVDLVRLGYEGWKAVYYGLIFPGFTAWWCSLENRDFAMKIYNCAEENLLKKILPILEFSLAGADRARQLMNKTGIS